MEGAYIMSVILNTRPTHQSENLTRLIEKSGSTVFNFPIIEILPVHFSPIKTDDFDIFIFLSTNAVNHFFAQHPLSRINSKIIAMGSATKKALNILKFHRVICPKYFSSEGILKMPLFHNIQNKSVVIISGENPKPLLQTVLMERDAIVKNIVCYARKPIVYDMTIAFPILVKNKIDIVISTSSESFFYLTRLFSPFAYRAWLMQKTLCVINEKMKNTAIDSGFKSVIQADNATDQMIVKAIM